MELTKEHSILQKVISEAWANPSFKQALLDDPQAAIKRLTGEDIELPEGKRLQVFDQSDPDIVCLNIPPQPSLENLELTDEQLEMIAGGVIPIDIIWDSIPPTWPPVPPQREVVSRLTISPNTNM